MPMLIHFLYIVGKRFLIKFDDNTNDLVDYVIIADGIFSNARSFFEKKKNSPKYKKALAVRVILKSKSELNINEQNVSLLMGGNTHIVIYPINKKKELKRSYPNYEVLSKTLRELRNKIENQMINIVIQQIIYPQKII